MSNSSRAGSNTRRHGGYDANYEATSELWGTEPGRVLRILFERVDLDGATVLDLGTGQGRNSAHLSAKGAQVTAVDVSELALRQARATHPHPNISWIEDDATTTSALEFKYDVVIAYGLLHCLAIDEIERTIDRMKTATNPGGYNVIVAFNSRRQDLNDAHPGFAPALLPHDYYTSRYSDRPWALEYATDEDLHEKHPPNEVWHVHAMTRLLARRERAA